MASIALILGRAGADFAAFVALHTEVIVVASNALEEWFAAVRDADAHRSLSIRLELQLVGVVAAGALFLARATARVTERVASRAHVRLGQQSAVYRVESFSWAVPGALRFSWLLVILVKVVLGIDVALGALVGVGSVTGNASWAAAVAQVVRLVEEGQAGENAGSSLQSVVSCALGAGGESACTSEAVVRAGLALVHGIF